ncbi:hypothetical protein RKD37_005782 [Streptomyces ambofaciens]|uniref:hypothetical protein n=1 Tax=unclassified Streptomyces TaxID=2593676 RepID=UPI000F4D28BA
MAKTAQTTSISPTCYGYCSWHRRFADGVRLIQVLEQQSGPGAALYACGPCREANRLVPFADRP